jgi:hypothetical protein
MDGKKVAVVVGGGSGMGAAAARKLAEKGFDVAVMSSSGKGEALGKELGGIGVTGSNRSGEDLDRLVKTTLDRWGRIDVLVNSAAHGPKGPVLELTDEQWHTGMDIYLLNVIRPTRLVTPVMEKQKSGAIINLASTSGIRFTGAFQVGYAATKAGVIQLSRVVAVQYAGKGIRVNTVIPGQLHTPMVEARLAKQRAGGDVAALLKERLARIPAGFMGDGRDTANAALFLASDEARFVTGTEIVVDGGRSIT